MNKELQMRSRRTAENCGMAFIGGLDENFQLIIRCPVHAYGVIQKDLQGAPHSPKCRFYSGSVEIKDVALPQFHGIFTYRNKKGQVKKYQAAFVYPLMADYMVSEDEFAKIQTLCTLLKLNGYEYYDKANRNIRSLFGLFDLPSQALLTDFEGAFCCVKATKVK